MNGVAPKQLSDRIKTLHAKLEALLEDQSIFEMHGVPLPDEIDNFKQKVEYWIMEFTKSD